jgi:protein arginine N-methyltransferase 3
MCPNPTLMYSTPTLPLCLATSILQVSTRVAVLKEKSLITPPTVLATFDMMTVRDADLDFDSSFSLDFPRDESFDGFVVYFDTDFDLRCAEPVTLLTGPQTTPTHWKQSIFYLASPIPVQAGWKLEAGMVAKRGKENNRDYEVNIKYCVVKADGSKSEVFVQQYLVN